MWGTRWDKIILERAIIVNIKMLRRENLIFRRSIPTVFIVEQFSKKKKIRTGPGT